MSDPGARRVKEEVLFKKISCSMVCLIVVRFLEIVSPLFTLWWCPGWFRKELPSAYSAKGAELCLPSARVPTQVKDSLAPDLRQSALLREALGSVLEIREVKGSMLFQLNARRARLSFMVSC